MRHDHGWRTLQGCEALLQAPLLQEVLGQENRSSGGIMWRRKARDLPFGKYINKWDGLGSPLIFMAYLPSVPRLDRRESAICCLGGDISGCKCNYRERFFPRSFFTCSLRLEDDPNRLARRAQQLHGFFHLVEGEASAGPALHVRSFRQRRSVALGGNHHGRATASAPQ